MRRLGEDNSVEGDNEHSGFISTVPFKLIIIQSILLT